MSTVSIIGRKIRESAITHVWPGALFACKIIKGVSGNHTFIEWDDSGPVVVKTAQEIADAQDAYELYLAGPEHKAACAVDILNDAANQTIFEALWELHRAIRGVITLPVETKAQYADRLKIILASKL